MTALLVGWFVLAYYSLEAALLLPPPLLVAYMLVCLALGVPS